MASITEQAHTPGPWVVSYDHPDEECKASIAFIRPLSEVPMRHNEIATLYGCDHFPEMAANAQLIAAAPDLLAAAIEFMHGEGNCKAARDMFRAAIAKATGVQP